MKAEFVPTKPPEQIVHLAEECAEVIKEAAALTERCAAVQKSVMKILRFGLDNENPELAADERHTNAEALRGELWDLEVAIASARAVLDNREKCPTCGSELMYMYGLAGGGIGSYTMCTNDDCEHFDKKQDPQSTPQEQEPS